MAWAASAPSLQECTSITYVCVYTYKTTVIHIQIWICIIVLFCLYTIGTNLLVQGIHKRDEHSTIMYIKENTGSERIFLNNIAG